MPDRALELIGQGAPITRAMLQVAKSHREDDESVAAGSTPEMTSSGESAEPSPSSPSSAASRREDLLARAVIHCEALASIVERMIAREPDALPALHERLAALCASCLAR